MRKIALALATGAALLAGAAVEAKPKLTGEEQLAKLLEGREAGTPVNCISLFDSRDQRVIDKTAIVYGSGSTIYVNRPDNARNLDRDDILVQTIRGSQVCNLDIVRLHDRTSQFYNGFVGLEKFVPYRKVARAD
jgi:hypothetical protein